MATVYMFKPLETVENLEIGQVMLTRGKRLCVVLLVDGPDVLVADNADGVMGFYSSYVYRCRHQILENALGCYAYQNGIELRWYTARNLSLPWIFGE